MKASKALVVSLLVIVGLLSACGPSEEEQNATVTKIAANLLSTQTAGAPTSTPIPAKKPTSTLTPTSRPSPTASPPPTFTPSLTTSEPPASPTPEPLATSTDLLAVICRDSMEGVRALTRDLGLPEHLTEMMPKKAEDDFDVNSYFSVLDHLSLEEGYTLDFVYFSDELGGKPMLYARGIDEPPFATYLEFIESKGGASYWERSYGGLEFAFEYLDFVHVDETVDGYLQFILLASFGDQFYLSWHALYHDEVILCNQVDNEKAIASVQDFNLDLPDEIIAEARTLNLEPTVTLDDESATVRIVFFTKWGGFIEVQYTFSREYPHRLMGSDFQPLIEYDCGISF